MAKKAKKTLPKKIYVYEEVDGEDKYLNACYDRDSTSDDAPRLIGTYELVETGEIKNEATYATIYTRK